MDIILVIAYYFGILGLIIALGIFLTKLLGKFARKMEEKIDSKKD